MSGDDTATAAMALDLAGAPVGAELDFVTIYEQWFHPVYRWIRALGGPGIEAEDLAQEVFIVVQRKLGRFDGANLPGWLYRIAQLTVRDHRRRRWFRSRFLRASDVSLDEIESPARSDDALARREQERRLYELVNQLNPQWREPFLLFEVGGLSGGEISELLGVPHATVRTYLFRARKAMVALVRQRTEVER